MRANSTTRSARFFFAVIISAMGLTVTRVEGHCDAIDGPVVVEAKKALADGDVTIVLKWVEPEYEGEIRALFAKTMVVRSKGTDARELADMYFFETLVRLHRAGEGAPYTGLKPAGTDPGPAVRAADSSLQSGNVDELAKRLSAQVEAGVRQRFAEAMKTQPHAEDSTAAGRAFVHAYVEFVHYVKGLHEMATEGTGHHGAAGEAESHGIANISECNHSG